MVPRTDPALHPARCATRVMVAGVVQPMVAVSLPAKTGRNPIARNVPRGYANRVERRVLPSERSRRVVKWPIADARKPPKSVGNGFSRPNLRCWRIAAGERHGRGAGRIYTWAGLSEIADRLGKAWRQRVRWRGTILGALPDCPRGGGELKAKPTRPAGKSP
jgi:hypothetical protein